MESIAVTLGACNVATPAPYVAPAAHYFPRDNDFTDYAAPTLKKGCAAFYDEIVRLAERTTGYCAYDTLEVSIRAGIGYSTGREYAKTLEAQGFVARCPQRKYLGTDARGEERWRGGENHFQLLGKENWRIFLKRPRKPRNGERPEVKPEVLAPRTLAEIKRERAKSQQERAENKRSKQDWSFKTKSQDNNTRRAKNRAASRAPEASPVVAPSSLDSSEHTKFTEREVAQREVCAPSKTGGENGDASSPLLAPGSGTVRDHGAQPQNPPQCGKSGQNTPRSAALRDHASPAKTGDENGGGSSPVLVAEVERAGVSAEVARTLVASNTPEAIRLQLDCLDAREPRNRAATLVSAINGKWEPPAKYLQALEAQERAQRAAEAQQRESRAKAAREAQEAAQRKEQASEEARLDAEWQAMGAEERAPFEAKLSAHFATRPAWMRLPSALHALRRQLQRGEDIDTPCARPGMLFQ